MSHLRAVEQRKWERRGRRAGHVRSTVFGTAERPRLSVYRSHRHFHAQLIDDAAGRTVASASSLQKELRTALKHGGDRKAAEAVGKKLAEAAKAAGVGAVVFDRNFFRFHGRVRAFAEGRAGVTGAVTLASLKAALKEVLPERNHRFLPLNFQAIDLGSKAAQATA